jgi:hypothetical protein
LSQEEKSPLNCGAEQLKRLRFGVSEFGFASLEDALDDELLAALQAEAAEQRSVTLRAEEDGKVPYRARLASLGEVARSFLSSEATRELLCAVFDKAFVLTDDASCFTYYSGGDYLGVHRDQQDGCMVTLIVYLDVASSDPRLPRSGMSLRVYGEALPKDDEPRLVIHTHVGSLVVGRGAHVWHERLRLREDESVVALTACFGSHHRV